MSIAIDVVTTVTHTPPTRFGMTQREAREAILAGNLRDHLGRKPVAIGVNPHNMSDCWLLYKRPENDDPLPISTDGVSAYLDWSQWIGKEKT